MNPETKCGRCCLHLACIKTHLAGIIRELQQAKTMKALIATLNLLWNKLPAIGVLFALVTVYRFLPANQPIPFAELIYSIVLVSAVIVVGPIVRLLVFNEAASYAESGQLDKDLEFNHATLNYRHYVLATVISYATALLCVSSLL
jgi:hypothetical protein